MHVYFLTRGIRRSRDQWVEFMSTRMFPWRRKNLQTKQWEWKIVQGALRPIELWEYVIPKNALQETLAMQHMANGDGSILNAANSLRPEINGYAKLMAKLLQLKEIPKFENPTKYGYKIQESDQPFPVNWVPTDGFAVYPIGIKEDVFQEFPDFKEPHAPKGFYQEGL